MGAAGGGSFWGALFTLEEPTASTEGEKTSTEKFRRGDTNTTLTFKKSLISEKDKPL